MEDPEVPAPNTYVVIVDEYNSDASRHEPRHLLVRAASQQEALDKVKTYYTTITLPAWKQRLSMEVTFFSQYVELL